MENEIISAVSDLLQKSYKKLKSSIFFDKTQLVLRNKIVEYESDKKFDPEFWNLSKCLLENDCSKILSSIGFLSFPKSTVSNDNDNIITNWDSNITTVKKYQYFLNMDVEGYILGVAWLLAVGYKLDKNIYEHSYGNRMKKNLLNKDGQATYSPYLFEPYFQQYESWRDKALSYAQKSLNKNQDVVILMLDFQRFFYSVDITEEELNQFVETAENDDEYFIYKEDCKCIIKELTKFVWNVIRQYSDKLREEDENLIGDRNVLPIGFHPSNVLSNVALTKFDDTMINGWNPIYYGRYVDDIIIVEKIEKNSTVYKKAKEGTLSADDVIEHYLTNCSTWQKEECHCKNNLSDGLLIKNEVNSESESNTINDSKENTYSLNPRYNQFSKSKIRVQQNKVKIFYFNSAKSDALLTCFKEQLNKNRSEFRFLPEDEAIFQNDDYSEIYCLQGKDSPNKLREIEKISVDKFSLSKHLGKYTRISGMIHDKIERNFDLDMEKIFTNQIIIDNYLMWEKVLEILITNDKFDSYVKFVKKIQFAIDNVADVKDKQEKLQINDADNIESQKIKILKSTLFDTLLSCIYRTLSLSWKSKTQKMQCELLEVLDKNNKMTSDTIDEMKYAYCYTRMCDKYAMPVMVDGFINYKKLKNNMEVNFTDFESIKNSSYKFDCFSGNEQSEYKYYPYLVTMNDLAIYYELYRLSCDCDKDNNVEELKKIYQKINYNNNNCEENTDEVLDEKNIYINDRRLNAIKIENKKFDSIKIAVANTMLYESNFDKILKDSPNRSYKRYKQLVTIINESISNKVDMLILPEGFLPFEWLPILARTCAKNQMAVITGIEHFKFKDKNHSNKPIVSNLSAVILPYIEDNYRFSYINFHKKVYMSPDEKAKIESYRCIADEGNTNDRLYELYCWNDFWFSVYCCYELTSIWDRALFQSYIDALIAVEWNKDTNYYSNIIESLSRDLHCYCIQVNTSEYGDSRITRPSKTENKDILKVKGGKNSAILYDSIDIKELRDFQIKGPMLQAKSPDYKLFKQTPPNFNYDVVLQRQHGTLWDDLNKDENK